MAISQNGPLGIISGKVGNFIGYNYRGIQVFRSAPKKSKRPPTIAQLTQQMRFGLAMGFLSPLKSITSKGYGNSQSTKSQSAQCMGYHTKNVITGTYPDFEIDYSKVVLTTGRLSGVGNGKVCSSREEFIDFCWAERMPSHSCRGTDEAILVAYSPSQHRHEFLRTKFKRADLFATLEVPMAFSGCIAHCWIMFVSEDGKEFSTSSYLGEVTVA